MYNLGVRLFIEVGPGNFLKSFINDILAGEDYILTFFG